MCGIKWSTLLRPPIVVPGTGGSRCLRSCELVVVVVGRRWAPWCGWTTSGVKDSDPWRLRLWPCGAVVAACPLLRLHREMLLALLLLRMWIGMEDWKLFIGDWSLNLLQ